MDFSADKWLLRARADQDGQLARCGSQQSHAERHRDVSSDVRKAAVLLMSLPPAQMARLLARFAGHDVLALADEIAKIDSVDPAEQRAVVRAFTVIERAQAVNRQATIPHAPFESLRNLPPAALWQILADEHPQTLALVLAHLPASTAAALLASLPDARQAEVAGRLATIDQVDGAVVDELERTVERRSLQLLTDRKKTRAGGPARVAEILCAADRAVAAAILDRLANDNPETAGDVRRWIAILEDLSVAQQTPRPEAA